MCDHLKQPSKTCFLRNFQLDLIMHNNPEKKVCGNFRGQLKKNTNFQKLLRKNRVESPWALAFGLGISMGLRISKRYNTVL